MTAPSLTIVVRSFNEGWALRETLAALAAQHDRDWELIVFDSGSTDGSTELIRRAAPRHFVELRPEAYRPGRVLNQAMALARSERVVFLNADATPQGPDWLGPLADALDASGVAAAYGRQIPRPRCSAAVARDYARSYGGVDDPGRRDPFFSMVSSALRRDVWVRRGFSETLQYSEDDEYTRWWRAAGLEIRYCPDSVVMHSHNYTPEQAYRRSFGESWAAAGIGPAAAPERPRGRSLLVGWLRDALGDLGYCARQRRLTQWPHTLNFRWQQHRGRRHGFKAGWRMHRVDRVV